MTRVFDLPPPLLIQSIFSRSQDRCGKRGSKLDLRRQLKHTTAASSPLVLRASAASLGDLVEETKCRPEVSPALLWVMPQGPQETVGFNIVCVCSVAHTCTRTLQIDVLALGT